MKQRPSSQTIAVSSTGWATFHEHLAARADSLALRGVHLNRGYAGYVVTRSPQVAKLLPHFCARTCRSPSRSRPHPFRFSPSCTQRTRRSSALDSVAQHQRIRIRFHATSPRVFLEQSTQRGPVDFSEGVVGNAATKRHTAGICVARIWSRRCASSSVTARLRCSGFDLHRCGRHLSEPLVRNSHDTSRRNRMVQQQRALDGFREQFESTAHDRTVGATAMKHETICIDHRDVGRADPVGSDARRNHFENSFLARRQDFSGIGIDDSQLRSGKCTTDTTELLLAPRWHASPAVIAVTGPPNSVAPYESNMAMP